MVSTTINADSVRQRWSNIAYHRSLEKSPLGKTQKFAVKGDQDGAVCVEKRDGLKDAESVTFTLFEELAGRGIGTGQLQGNEEDIPNKSTKVHPVWSRNATTIPKSQQRIAATNMYAEQYRTLTNWNDGMHRDYQVESLASIGNVDAQINEAAGIGRMKTWYDRSITTADGTVVALTTSNAERDAFVLANARRLFFGAENAGLASGDWSASLANIAAGDVFSATVAEDVVYAAQDENWRLNQYRIAPLVEKKYGEGHYMVFHSTASFLRLKDDLKVHGFYEESVSHKGLDDNPYFRLGDLYYGGAIHRRVQYIDKFIEPSLASTGASNIDLTCAFVCGQMGMVCGYGSPTIMTNDNITDYGFHKPVGIESNYGYEKTFFGSEQYGVLPVFTAKI